MATSIRRVGYYKLRADNRPGEGARLLQLLKKQGVNLLAMSAFPVGKGVQIDLVPEDPERLVAAAAELPAKLSQEKTGFLAQGGDTAGVLVPILKKLGEARINVIAIDAVSAGKKRYGAIFWVKPRDVEKTAQLLRAK